MSNDRPDRDPASPPRGEAGLRSAYRDAVALAEAERVPRPDVRRAVLAQAQAIAAGHERVRAAGPGGGRGPAANAPQWRMAAVASVCIMGFVGLLSWHVQREDDASGGLSGGRQAMAPAPQAADSARAERKQEAPAPVMSAAPPPHLPAEERERRAVTAAAPAPAPVQERLAQRAPAPQAPSRFKPESAAGNVAGMAPQSREYAKAHAPADPAAAQDTAAPAAETTVADAARPAAVPVPSPFPANAPQTQQRQGDHAEIASPRVAAAPPAGAMAKSSRGASLFAQHEPPASALHRAAGSGDLPALKVQLGAGAGVDTPDPAGRTPLALAVRGGHVEAARLLLDAGADPLQADRQGVTPLQLARESGSQPLQALLEAAVRPR